MLTTQLLHFAIGLLSAFHNPKLAEQKLQISSYCALISEWVDLKLLNNSDESIKLHIPNVMNPNLSPHSESGVSIEVGTMVYFYHKKKKYELIEITSTMEKVVIIDELVKKRKAELGL